MRGIGDPASLPTAFFISVGVVVVVVAVLLLQALVFDYERTVTEQRLIERPPAERLETEAAQRALLGEYAWVDREAGKVRIPIDRAVELIIEEAGRQ